MSGAAFHTLRIADVRRETADALSLALDVPPELADRFRFQPGQYLTLRTQLDGQDTRRSYSICSAPDENELRVAIKRLPGGRFSAWAHDTLVPGHTVEVMAPAGRFGPGPAPAPAAPRHLLLVAAGSGITPILSILAHTLAHEPHTRVTLLYGSRSTAHILFRDRLEALKDRHMARLAVVHVLSREQQDIPVLNGRLDGPKVLALLRGARPDLALLCGPADMIDGVTQALVGAGMPPETVRSERFTAAGQPPHPTQPRPAPPAAPTLTSTGQTARIIADGIQTLVPLAPGETVLDAALNAGLDLPYSCRAGMCSTCRARLVAGTAPMAVNYGLEPWETQAGYILTCQAHPTTPEVTVDFDQV